MDLDECITALADRLQHCRAEAEAEVAAQQAEYDRLKEVWRKHGEFLRPFFDHLEATPGLVRQPSQMIGEVAHFSLAVKPLPRWSPPLTNYWPLDMRVDGFSVKSTRDLATAEIKRSGFEDLDIPTDELTLEAVEAAFVEWADTIAQEE